MVSGWKTMTSSIRFRNSGRNWIRSASVTAAFIASYASSPSPPLAAAMAVLPTLLVMITTAFLKSTVRPWLSVRRPSSRTWSRTLNTSGCAFSISSSRTTWYGRRRTASVSWPPSS